LDGLQDASRDDVFVDGNKRNPKDFVLWFTKSKFGEQAMMWDSPWGRGFPGWHIECSAMSMKYLGEHFDIHCGGIDAIPVHHTNEIAQSEAATGRTWVNYWMHGEFLLDDRGKMSKSNGEFLTLGVLQEKGYDPMDYRYFCLGGHYRSQLKFSYTSLDGAREARNGVVSRIRDLLDQGAKAGSLQSEAAKAAKAEFAEHITNDLNSPRALADLWGTLKNDNLTPDERYSLALDYDRVLGLELASVGKSQEKAPIVDEKALLLLSARTKAKEMKDWGTADRIRAELDTMGYEVKDTSQGPVLVRKRL
jgi:cysteinyl-tRNA synthetase